MHLHIPARRLWRAARVACLVSGVVGLSAPLYASPISFTFRGTLDDGGSFEGSMTYGDIDRDSRAGFGRYNALWDVFVNGGSQTENRHLVFPDGRAVVETSTNTGNNVIGVIFLGPGDLSGLTPHFFALGPFNPDVQPSLAQLGALVPGSTVGHFSNYFDGVGGNVLISSFELNPVPEPASLILMGSGVSALMLRRRRRTR
jgi:hypothetical protein